MNMLAKYSLCSALVLLLTTACFSIPLAQEEENCRDKFVKLHDALANYVKFHKDVAVTTSRSINFCDHFEDFVKCLKTGSLGYLTALRDFEANYEKINRRLSSAISLALQCAKVQDTNEYEDSSQNPSSVPQVKSEKEKKETVCRQAIIEMGKVYVHLTKEYESAALVTDRAIKRCGNNASFNKCAAKSVKVIANKLKDVLEVSEKLESSRKNTTLTAMQLCVQDKKL